MIKAFLKVFLTKGQGTVKSVRSVGYNEVLLYLGFFLRHILLLPTWGKENRSLYRGLRYIRIKERFVQKRCILSGINKRNNIFVCLVIRTLQYFYLIVFLQT